MRYLVLLVFSIGISQIACTPTPSVIQHSRPTTISSTAASKRYLNSLKATILEIDDGQSDPYVVARTAILANLELLKEWKTSVAMRDATTITDKKAAMDFISNTPDSNDYEMTIRLILKLRKMARTTHVLPPIIHSGRPRPWDCCGHRLPLGYLTA